MICHMHPADATDNSAYGSLGKAVHAAKIGLVDTALNIPSANRDGLVLGNLGIAVRRSSAAPFWSRVRPISFAARPPVRRDVSTILGASSGPAIIHVVSMCSEPKVARIATTRIIARVKDKHSLRDWPVGLSPRKAVGANRPVAIENPIPIRVFAAGIQPALIYGSGDSKDNKPFSGRRTTFCHAPIITYGGATC